MDAVAVESQPVFRDPDIFGRDVRFFFGRICAGQGLRFGFIRSVHNYLFFRMGIPFSDIFFQFFYQMQSLWRKV